MKIVFKDIEIAQELMSRLTVEALEFIAYQYPDASWSEIENKWRVAFPNKSMFLSGYLPYEDNP